MPDSKICYTCFAFFDLFDVTTSKPHQVGVFTFANIPSICFPWMSFSFSFWRRRRRCASRPPPTSNCCNWKGASTEDWPQGRRRQIHEPWTTSPLRRGARHPCNCLVSEVQAAWFCDSVTGGARRARKSQEEPGLRK